MKPYVRAVEQRLDVSSNYEKQKGIHVPSETTGLDKEPAKRIRLTGLAGKRADDDWLGRKLTRTSDQCAFLISAGLQGTIVSSALQGAGKLADGLSHGVGQAQ